MRLGIDFGTTRTVVSVCDRGNYPVVSFVGPGGESLEWYPTLVAERKGELCFGLEALARVQDPEWETLRSFKRWLADPATHPGRIVRIGNTEIAVLDLISAYLRAMRIDIFESSNLPVPRQKGEKLSAVVAVPANAHSTQRFITMEAFKKAGFEVDAALNEPSSAGVEYAHRYRKTITSRRENVLVYDLGGGTFDASLVQMSGRVHDVLAVSGIARLGGDDFDDCLVDLVLREHGIERGKLSSRSLGLLTGHCCEQKERLHPNSRKITVDLGHCLTEAEQARHGISPDDSVLFTTKKYYEACEPLVDRTIEILERICPEAVLATVAGLYVVGGASSLPVVARKLRDEFGRRVHRSAYPSAAIAIGLAIAFDEASDFEITERYSRNFGVFREANSGAEVAFDRIFDAQTKLPEPSAPSNVLVRQYRAAHNVGHFRYVECGWLDDRGVPQGDIAPFADVLFPFDPKLRELGVDLRQVEVARTNGQGPMIEERYAVDAGGMVNLTITDLDTGYECRHKLARH